MISWLLLVAVFSTHCHMYRLQQGDPQTHDVPLFSDRGTYAHVVVHVGDAYWELSNPRKTENGIIGRPVPVGQEVSFYYQKALLKRNFKASKSMEYYLNQLHIFTKEAVNKGEEIFIPVEKIEKVQVLNENKVLTTLSFVGIGAGSVIAGIWIFLFIACGCPHTYVYNGNNWVYTNTLYTGALNSKLERYDHKRIPDLNPESSNYYFQVKNEEKETQYTNELKLIAIYHDKGKEVVSDKLGIFHGFSKMIEPKIVHDDNGVSKLNLIAQEDKDAYDFKSTGENNFSSLYAIFESDQFKPNTKLIINAKNTKWSGYLYHEFTALFGSTFDNWVRSNAKKSKNHLIKNIDKAGIFLNVEVLDGKNWRKIEQIELIGDVNYNKMAINIPEKYLKNKSLKIRLRSGYHFWEVDQMVLAETDNEKLEIETLNAIVSSDKNSTLSAKLSKNDTDYLIHNEGEDPINISFEGLKTKNRTLFLVSKGYYRTNLKHEGKPDIKKLLEINKAGGLSMFSQEKYEQILRLNSFFAEQK